MTIQDDPLIGHEIDGYHIEKLLGAGGMARVYRAQEVRLGRYAAIKVILPEARMDPEYTRRFEIEARAVAALQHPGIVSIYRFGEAQGLYYMAMQFIEGADLGWLLSDYRSRAEFMPPDDVLNIVRQLASALDYAHNQSVIHRDFKPANVMVDKDGRAVLTDFGLALLLIEGTRGEVFGTPHYIAPEQAVSSAGSVPASDQYSLGVMLYEMFTGTFPFDGKSAMDIALAHMTDPLPSPLERNPDLNPAFVPVLEKALAKEPENRYSSCTELAVALEQIMRYSGKTALSSARVSMLKVTDEVRTHREANPLPPLPAPIQAGKSPPAPVTVEKVHDTPIAPSSQTARSSSLLRPTEPRHVWQLAGLASLTVVIIGMVVLALMLAQRNSLTVTPAGTVPSQPEQVADGIVSPDVPPGSSILPASSTPTTEPTATTVPPPTSVPPTGVVEVSAPTVMPSPVIPTAVPTSTPQLWAILLIARGDESFYVINQSEIGLPAFSLAPFAFRVEDRGLIIAKWEGKFLNPGECVRLEKNKNADSVAVGCDLVERFKAGGNERFWQDDDDTTIIYYGNWIRECPNEQLQSDTGCLLLVPTTADLAVRPDFEASQSDDDDDDDD